MAALTLTKLMDRVPVGNEFMTTVRATSGAAAAAADEWLDFRTLGFQTISAMAGWIPVGQSAIGAKATGTVTFSATDPTDTETITINGVVYTIHTTVVTTGAYSVLRSTTENTQAANFLKAINRTGVPGTDYSLYVPMNSDVVASGAAAVITLTARQFGANGNGITLAAAGGSTTVSGATLTGGADPVTSGVFRMNAEGTGQTEGAQMGRVGVEFAAASVLFELTILGR
jgi:hypothetical protein